MLPRLLVVVLVLSLALGQRRGKGNSGKGANKDNGGRVAGERVERPANGAVSDDSEEDSDDSTTRTIPLPKITELVEDENVEQGPVHRRFSGENHSQLSCKGVVQGLTPEGGRPYFRYIKVNTSSCLQRDIIFPNFHYFSYEVDSVFDLWNISVTRLVFRGEDKKMAFKIPKRISMPTNVMFETGYYETDFRGHEKRDHMETYFGFGVFFPALDQQVQWTVEWEIGACFNTFDEETDTQSNICEDYYNERSHTYDRNAFHMAQEGFQVWQMV